MRSDGICGRHVSSGFFFKQKTAYEMRISDWSSDVCSSDLTRAAELSQLPLLADELLGQAHLFPEGRLDQDLQQVDLRGRNSWRLQMDEVPSVELLETQLVNAVAPFIINARLKPLMLRTHDGEADRKSTRLNSSH